MVMALRAGLMKALWADLVMTLSVGVVMALRAGLMKALWADLVMAL